MSLSARTKGLLENARREAEPTPEDLRRVRARLSASVASVAETPSVVAVPFAFLKVLGGLAAVAAVGYGAWQWSKRQPVAEVPPPPPVSIAQACPPTPQCPPVAEAAPTKPLQCPPAAPVACAKVPDRALQKERGVQSHTFSTPADVGDQWELELGLLSDARIALDTERALDALGAMQKHERLFPNSAFTEERLAIQVMATCLMGQRDAARPLFEQLLQRDPESTYLPRVHSACGADFGQPKVDDEHE